MKAPRSRLAVRLVFFAVRIRARRRPCPAARRPTTIRNVVVVDPGLIQIREDEAPSIPNIDLFHQRIQLEEFRVPPGGQGEGASSGWFRSCEPGGGHYDRSTFQCPFPC